MLIVVYTLTAFAAVIVLLQTIYSMWLIITICPDMRDGNCGWARQNMVALAISVVVYIYLKARQ